MENTNEHVCPSCGKPADWGKFINRILLTGEVTCPNCKETHKVLTVNPNNALLAANNKIHRPQANS